MISTTDYFFPLVNDPYVMGKIACANVLSDAYSNGVTDIDNMLMILSSSRKLTSEENDVCMRLIIKGFNDLAKEAGTEVTGGQTVKNDDMLLGGVAMSYTNNYIEPYGALPGDVLILTKPIGTQVSVNVNQWFDLKQPFAEKVKPHLSQEDVTTAYLKSMYYMSSLNLTAAKLMHEFNAHAATDITGFGLLGHAQNLATSQRLSVNLEIHTLPAIQHMLKVDSLVNNMFKLKDGFSAETSGGLLIALPSASANQFIQRFKELTGNDSWIVGRVLEGERKAYIVDSPTLVEV